MARDATSLPALDTMRSMDAAPPGPAPVVEPATGPGISGGSGQATGITTPAPAGLEVAPTGGAERRNLVEVADLAR